MKKTIYFLCTGNSCRSQIAEAYGKIYLKDWNVYSAGIEAHGLNPNAINIMKDDGIDISNQTSDIIDNEILEKADLVVTLCGHADNMCPVIKSKVHWAFDDPAGHNTEVFERVRDEIKNRIILFKETGE